MKTKDYTGYAELYKEIEKKYQKKDKMNYIGSGESENVLSKTPIEDMVKQLMKSVKDLDNRLKALENSHAVFG